MDAPQVEKRIGMRAADREGDRSGLPGHQVIRVRAAEVDAVEREAVAFEAGERIAIERQISPHIGDDPLDIVERNAVGIETEVQIYPRIFQEPLCAKPPCVGR